VAGGFELYIYGKFVKAYMQNTFVLLFFLMLFEACSNPVKVKVESVTIQEIEIDSSEGPAPPPPPKKLSDEELKKKSGTIAAAEMNFAQWLKHICKNQPQTSDIRFYHFGLLDADKTTLICFTGSREKNNGNKDWKGTNNFEPELKYFSLTGESFYNDDNVELQKNIGDILKQFSLSKEFLNSYLNKATQITYGFDNTFPQILK
jgi:hypothetical protein